MHSFHPSRGRILFEVLCLFAAAAAAAGAWRQTGASAMLGLAAIAAVYGLVHMFDLRRRKPAETAAPQRIDFAAEAGAVPLVTEERPTLATVDVAEVAEPVPARAGRGRRSGSRKGGGRRAKSPKAAPVREAATVIESDVPWPIVDEACLSDAALPADDVAIAAEAEVAPAHIAPLFEPDPFVRMPRQAFGRRGRI